MKLVNRSDALKSGTREALELQRYSHSTVFYYSLTTPQEGIARFSEYTT